MLGSCVTVAVEWAGNCSSKWTPRQKTIKNEKKKPQKKKKKKKKKRKKTISKMVNLTMLVEGVQVLC